MDIIHVKFVIIIISSSVNSATSRINYKLHTHTQKALRLVFRLSNVGFWRLDIIAIWKDVDS